MNAAIAITNTGTTEPTTLPVGVSPIVRATNPPTAAATTPAITKISTAATTFGIYAPIAATKLSSAAIPNCETAIANAPKNKNQNASAPIVEDGFKSGAVSVMHQTVRRLGNPDFFVSALVARWRAATAMFSWVNCGHPPTFLVATDNTLSELTGPQHDPLGVGDDEREFSTNERQLLAG